MPMVSIIIPAYNVQRYVAETIRSVVSQTWRDWELIIVDDASTDDSWQQIEMTAAGDTRIRLFRNSENRGVGAAANQGFREANGLYVARLDADDVAYPNWLENRLAHMKADVSRVLVSGSRSLIDEDGKHIGRTHEDQLSTILAWELIFGNPIPQSGTVCSMEAVRRVGGYDERFRTGQDWDLWVKLSAIGGLAIVDVPMIKYRVTAHGISARYAYDRKAKESLLHNVMPRMATMSTGRSLPEELMWVLYRNRSVMHTDREICQQAIQCLFDLYGSYLNQNAMIDGGALLGISVLDKVAHIIAGDKWSLPTRYRTLRATLGRVGCRAVVSWSGCRSLVKLLAPLPLPFHQ